ncbi:hypothetical protein COLO4_16379 [Corchorus olitorius]|uniref:Uncharacterized protein n=1 Tax=Corchorus olitorius TaxID=93759 RepID=A0A1R3JHV4_9ROSI|nr:hypothetical protein COLO4_16379 [Corchorus olitorius]
MTSATNSVVVTKGRTTIVASEKPKPPSNA